MGHFAACHRTVQRAGAGRLTQALGRALQNMRIFLVLTILLIVVACVGTPHMNATEITSVEVGVYKLGLETGCSHAGRNRGDPETKVSTFCKCVIATLEKRMTAREWQDATFYAQQRRDRDEQGVMSPHMSAVAACKQL